MISVLKWTNLHFFIFFSAWLITTLVILLIYLCTRCCDTKSTKHRKSRPIRCLLSFFALVTTAGLAGGFWGNHVLHGGMEEFQTATQKIVEHVRHIQEMSKRYNEALQVCKGQIISECLFDFLNVPKKPPKNLTNFCPRT